MKYQFEGFDAHGAVVKDQIDAENEGKAAEKLREKGVFAQKIQLVDGTPMKSVLGAGRKLDNQGPMPWESKPAAALSPAPPAVKESGPAAPQKPVEVKSDWRLELVRDLRAIALVLKHCEKSKKAAPAMYAALDELPPAAVKAGKEMAAKELIAKAIAAAVKKELWSLPEGGIS